MMFGKLSLSSIPFSNPIAMGAFGFVLLSGVVIVILITYFGKWTYLWKEWLTSLDHKKIGIMYIILALVMLLRGFSDAIMMRSQQMMALGPHSGYLPPHHFDQVFTAHGTIMIFFMAMPFLIGLMNIVVPQQIGARDVAFPFLNSVSLWLTASAAMLVMLSLGIGAFSTAGWSGYAPFSELKYSPGVGVDYWIWGLQISGIGTTLTGINFMTTILKKRAPGMKLMRMPLFTWTALCTNVLMTLAFPVLTVLLTMLALDRYVGMHFFTNTGGGNMMMFPNLWWIWGHPEVYILILPAFGVYSEVVSTFSSKRLFGYKSLVYATIAIAFFSFTVWVHHFFTMGSGANVNAVFGIATMIIAVPTGVKIFDWLMTMFRGRIRFTTPMLWTLGFIVTFVIGGMSGVLLAVPPADFVMHNSTFLVAHFHNMLIPGSLFGFFAGYAYWFPKAFGFRLNEYWGRWAFWCWLIGFYLAFMPLYALGFMGMPRRMEHYDNPAWQPLLIVAAIGAGVILIGIVCQIIQLVVSIRRRDQYRDSTGDPWGGRTLEWTVASPPPPYNFAEIPHIHDRDELTYRKDHHTGRPLPAQYHDILMPKNSGAGFVLGGTSFVLGFALIWHIWWLVIVSVLVALGTILARTARDDVEYAFPAKKIEQIEQQHQQELDAASERIAADAAVIWPKGTRL